MKGSATLATVTCQHKITRTRDAVPYLETSAFFFKLFKNRILTHTTLQHEYSILWWLVSSHFWKALKYLSRDPIRPLRAKHITQTTQALKPSHSTFFFDFFFNSPVFVWFVLKWKLQCLCFSAKQHQNVSLTSMQQPSISSKTVEDCRDF